MKVIFIKGLFDLCKWRIGCLKSQPELVSGPQCFAYQIPKQVRDDK